MRNNLVIAGSLTIIFFSIYGYGQGLSGNYTDSSSPSEYIENSTKSNAGNETTNNYAEVLLYKCPESNISTDRRLTIPSKYFKDDYSDVEGRFTEKVPDCVPHLISDKFILRYSFNESERDFLYEDGWLFKSHSEDYFESIPPERYCVSDFDSNEFIVQYCRSECGTEPCISKCCYADEVCNLDNSEEGCDCTHSGNRKWTSTVNSELGKQNLFVHHYLPCDGPDQSVHFTLHQNSGNLNWSYRNEFKITKNGSVLIKRKTDGKWLSFPDGTYCIDGAVRGNSSTGMQYFSGDFLDTVLHLCRSGSGPQDELGNEQQQRDNMLYRIFVPFATVFIILTLIVYFLTWSEQNIHGYTVFFYLISLMLLYIILIVHSIRSIAHPKNYPKLCSFIATAMHFSYLTSICWLTSISFDVWRSFRKMNTSAVQRRRMRKMCLYCLFSFGYPLLQVSICFGLDVMYRDVPEGDISFILPRYGQGNHYCTMSNDGITYYLYTPIGILLCCNILLFVATIATMTNYRRGIRQAFAEIAKNSSSSVNQSFCVFLRLFIIMGIFWIVQFIAWFIPNKNKYGGGDSAEHGLQIIFDITDALTIFQAVVIFYIFACKRSIFVKLWNLHSWLRPFLSLLIRGGCCTTPPPDLRKCSAQSQFQGTLRKKESFKSRKGSSETSNRTSRESDCSVIVPGSSVSRSEVDRKFSVTSSSTTTTEMDAPRSSVSSEKRVQMGNNETAF